MNEKIILDIARKSIDKIVIENKKWDPDLDDKKYKDFRELQGAFVTLYTGDKENKQLRGCIGIPNPVYPLGKAISSSARSAASSDPRFKKVEKSELNSLLMSVEILSPIKEIEYLNFDDLKKLLVLGRDGLIIEHKGSRGLLLPKVPLEYNWNLKTYLTNLCRKATISDDLLYHKNTRLFAFTSDIYKAY